MNRKEVRDIKKRFDDDLSNFYKIYGCYVNAAKEVVAKMELQVLDMDQEEREMYSGILKKTLSGSLGRNLVEVAVPESSDESKLLQVLKENKLGEASFRDALYDRIIESIEMPEKSFVILLASDSYDIQYKGSDDEVFNEASYEMFDYILCAVCPVKDPKSALRYLSNERSFKGSSTGSILCPPQIGFMYPTLDEGSADVTRALYYTKSSSDNHSEVIKAVFNSEIVPLPAETQMNAFSGALEEALEEECSMDVVKLLQSKIITNLEEHKDSNSPEAPEMYVREVQDILREGGVSEERVNNFKETCDRYFDNATSLNPSNLMSSKILEIKNQEIDVKIDPGYAFQVTTKEIDGRNYILIPVGEGLTVNGVEVSIANAESSTEE